MPPKKVKRADNRYQTTLTIGRTPEGKPIKKYFYGETQKEANEKKKAYLDGAKKLNEEADNMTIEKWGSKWWTNYTKGGYRHRLNIQGIVNSFVSHVGKDTVLMDIRPVDIQSYAKSIEHRSKSHIGKVRLYITAMFRAALENDYIIKNPCEGIVWNFVKNGSHEALEQWQIDLITKHWSEHKAGTWAMISLYAGLRPSECFALDRSNVTEEFITVTDGSHFEHGQLVIVKGETKSNAGQRKVPVPKPLKPVIAALPSEGLVCRSASGNPVSESAYKRNWVTFWNILEQLYNDPKAKIKKAGRRTDRLPKDYKRLDRPEMYTLRHTYCSMLYDADVDVKTAQYLMGHSSLDMTLKIYTHLSEKKKAHSFDKWLKHFEPNEDEQDVKQDVKNP